MFRVCIIPDNTKASTQLVAVLLLSARSLVQISVQRLAMLPEVLIVIRQPRQIPMQYLKIRANLLLPDNSQFFIH